MMNYLKLVLIGVIFIGNIPDYDGAAAHSNKSTAKKHTRIIRDFKYYARQHQINKKFNEVPVTIRIDDQEFELSDDLSKEFLSVDDLVQQLNRFNEDMMTAVKKLTIFKEANPRLLEELTFTALKKLKAINKVFLKIGLLMQHDNILTIEDITNHALKKSKHKAIVYLSGTRIKYIREYEELINDNLDVLCFNPDIFEQINLDYKLRDVDTNEKVIFLRNLQNIISNKKLNGIFTDVLEEFPQKSFESLKEFNNMMNILIKNIHNENDVTIAKYNPDIGELFYHSEQAALSDIKAKLSNFHLKKSHNNAKAIIINILSENDMCWNCHKTIYLTTNMKIKSKEFPVIFFVTGTKKYDGLPRRDLSKEDSEKGCVCELSDNPSTKMHNLWTSDMTQ